MASPAGERAIEDALRAGNALLKFISPNDAGATDSNQCGFYLPKPAWQMFSLHPPIDGRNDHQDVEIVWQRELVTQSVIHWYGQSETQVRVPPDALRARIPLHQPGGGRRPLRADPARSPALHAYVLSRDEDIADVRSRSASRRSSDGASIRMAWRSSRARTTVSSRHSRDSPSRCRPIFRRASSFSSAVHAMLGNVRAQASRACRRTPRCCARPKRSSRCFERSSSRLCQDDIGRPFRDIDDFIQTAGRLMNRRKSRAGRSLENHVEHLLRAAGIPHEMRPDIDGKPDVVIPSAAAYRDDNLPGRPPGDPRHQDDVQGPLASGAQRRPARAGRSTFSRCSRASRHRSSPRCRPRGSRSWCPNGSMPTIRPSGTSSC